MPDARQLAADIFLLAEILRRKARTIGEDRLLLAAEERAREALSEPGRDPVAELRRRVEAAGFQVFPGDLVTTAAAAALLGITAGHLRNVRDNIPFHRAGRRCWYSLATLARHVTSCSNGARPGENGPTSTAP